MGGAVVQGRWDAACRLEGVEANVTAGIVEHSRKQLYELDRQHRMLKELAITALEMEHRLGVEIRAHVLKSFSALELQLTNVSGRLGSYLKQMQESVVGEVSVLRESLLSQLQECSKRSSNLALQQKVKSLRAEIAAEKLAHENGPAHALPGVLAAVSHSKPAMESDKPPFDHAKRLDQPFEHAAANSCLSEGGKREIEALHEDLQELTAAHNKLEVLFRGRFLSSRQKYERDLQAFKTALSSNADLWDLCAGAREFDTIVEGELGNSQHRAERIAQTIQKLVLEAAAQDEEAARLKVWRQKAFGLFEKLLKEEAKYEQVDNYDLEKLSQSVKKLDQDIGQASRDDLGGHVEDRTMQRTRVEQDRAQTQQWVLKRKLAAEVSLTDKALSKADLIRRELECGQVADNESDIGHLVTEFTALELKAKLVAKENAVLVATLPKQDRGVRRGGLQKMALKADDMQHLREQVLMGTDFQEKLCFSVSAHKSPKVPHWHKTLDDERLNEHEGVGESPQSSCDSPRSIRSPTTPRSLSGKSPRNPNISMGGSPYSGVLGGGAKHHFEMAAGKGVERLSFKWQAGNSLRSGLSSKAAVVSSQAGTSSVLRGVANDFTARQPSARGSVSASTATMSNTEMILSQLASPKLGARASVDKSSDRGPSKLLMEML